MEPWCHKVYLCRAAGGKACSPVITGMGAEPGQEHCSWGRAPPNNF